MSERASIFDEADELDLSGFQPRTLSAAPLPAREAIRAVAEQRGFVSRDPAPVSSVPKPDPNPGPMTRRRYTTGRNRQLNMKVTDEALRRFYAVADASGWVLGEAFEHAVAALEREVDAGRAAPPERTSDIGVPRRP